MFCPQKDWARKPIGVVTVRIHIVTFILFIILIFIAGFLNYSFYTFMLKHKKVSQVTIIFELVNESRASSQSIFEAQDNASKHRFLLNA